MNCKNCDTEINQNYCPNCGKAATLKRIDHHYIVHEITHLFTLRKGSYIPLSNYLQNQELQ